MELDDLDERWHRSQENLNRDRLYKGTWSEPNKNHTVTLSIIGYTTTQASTGCKCHPGVIFSGSKLNPMTHIV